MQRIAGGCWDAMDLFTGVCFVFSLQTLLVYGQKGDGCGHTVLSPRSGTVASRNYPGTYPNHTHCEWSLRVPQGHTLHLTFGDFDLEWSHDCRAGSLTVIDKSGVITLGPLCGQLAASSRNVSVKSSEVTVRFVSSTHRSGRGFLLSYSTSQHPDLISCLQRGSHFSSQQISAFCPGGCKAVVGEIWGHYEQGYRDTSVLCKAAVHAGVISDSQGGTINVTQQRGITLYESSFDNGILSKTGSLSDKRLVFSRVGESPLVVTTYNASSLWEEEDRLGWPLEDRGVKGQGLSWTASVQDEQPWLELELWNRSSITGIITKGLPNMYIETYTLMYSKDRKIWKVYKDPASKEKKVFESYSDGHTVAFNTLLPPISARYLQLRPQRWHGRASAEVQVLGIPLPPIRPRSTGTGSTVLKLNPTKIVHQVSTESPVMTKSLNESSSQSLMLLVGVILGVALCLGCLFAGLLWRRRKKAVHMKKCCLDSGSESFNGKKLPYADSELIAYPLTRSVHDTLPNPPLNDYAEPDVLAGGQKVGLTFRPELEEGYTVPFALNHYDTPGQLPEYAEPLPPEPEYATPFGEQCPDPSIPPQLDTLHPHSQRFQTVSGTQVERVLPGQPEYDCPAHRGLSNGYCTPAFNGTCPRKASVIYTEPQPLEPLLQHTYHEPL
ncbi:discoidin, CUB and LCCL domain-containing protein 1-like [Astyanax mexicanus]|uniref:Discoidin, CUB and LCCL domain containing 1 n=1 Tax=Astyanax mexicanus TaxID=7994 RepID=A0A8B9JWS2_ASTMX|nr:discoidin, CUB and LCCL domain-containing protein 1-like [Astyanax mexicanus]